jgi:hypothetical protein
MSGSPVTRRSAPAVRHPQPSAHCATAQEVHAGQHLVHESSVVALIVPRIDALKSVPVLGKDLFEDVPILRGFGMHQAASLRGVGLCVIARFYHIPPTTSTPSSE